MGLRDEEQQDLHDNYWLKIERALGAKHTTEPTDTFLRDFLRWQTGEVHGIDRVYDGLRRWAVLKGHGEDRPALCRSLARLARLYGILTGSAGKHDNASVEREIRHLRDMGIDIHRPLTLRLLNDASDRNRKTATNVDLAKVLAGIGTWTTRLWLADRATAGLNRAVVDLANGPGPGDDVDFAEHWLGRIRRLRNTRVGVPSDEEVGEGIRSRKAYGGGATRSSFAVLCALMEAEHKEEAPDRSRLTIEHVMPQKLTEDWKRALGDDPEEKHGRYRDRLANLTLSGDATNSSMSAGTFAAKREVYRNSSIGMTRRLAVENDWNEEALERHAEELTRRVLDRWPWPQQSAAPQPDAAFRWRIEDEPWHTENVASQMVLNVAGALLSRDPVNVGRLSGEAIRPNVHSAKRYPPGTTAGTLTMRAVPGHHQYVLYPYERDYPTSAERCGVRVGVELDGTSRTQTFWKFFKKQSGGLPGQNDSWRGATQWTSPLNSFGDRIGIYVGNPDLIWLYIRAGEAQGSNDRAARMRQYSWTIREQMGDQTLGPNVEKNSIDGTTVTVQTAWTRDDEAEWPEAARWIAEQHERLRAILEDPSMSGGSLEP